MPLFVLGECSFLTLLDANFIRLNGFVVVENLFFSCEFTETTICGGKMYLQYSLYNAVVSFALFTWCRVSESSIER